MKAKIFDPWFLQGVDCAFSKFTPKFLIMVFCFAKIKGVSGEALQQEIWKLKNRPEAFIQKVPPLAKSKLVLRIFDERFGFEPENYTKITWYENSVGDEKKEIYTGGKEVKLALFHSEEPATAQFEYIFDKDNFYFEFMHPLIDKKSEDKVISIY